MNEIIKKNGIKFGIISGLLSIVITLGIYLIDYKLFASSAVGVTSIIAGIVISILLFVTTKKEFNGELSFKDGSTTYFVYAINSIAIATLFNILLYNVIDTDLKEKVTGIIIEKTAEVMKSFGGSSQMLKETIKQMKEQDQFSISNLAISSIWTLAFSCIWGLILAAIFKSKTNSPFNE